MDLEKKSEPFPRGTVNVRFSDWSRPREGSFQWSRHGFYSFFYRENGKQRLRQASPGYDPVDIILQDGKNWSVYLNDPKEQGNVD